MPEPLMMYYFPVISGLCRRWCAATHLNKSRRLDSPNFGSRCEYILDNVAKGRKRPDMCCLLFPLKLLSILLLPSRIESARSEYLENVAQSHYEGQRRRPSILPESPTEALALQKHPSPPKPVSPRKTPKPPSPRTRPRFLPPRPGSGGTTPRGAPLAPKRQSARTLSALETMSHKVFRERSATQAKWVVHDLGILINESAENGISIDEVFSALDYDKDGVLNVSDLQHSLDSLHLSLDVAGIEHLMHIIGRSKKVDSIPLRAFKKYYHTTVDTFVENDAEGACSLSHSDSDEELSNSEDMGTEESKQGNTTTAEEHRNGQLHEDDVEPDDETGGQWSQRFRRRVHRALLQEGLQFDDLFESFDRNRSGEITVEECRLGLEAVGVTLSQRDMSCLEAYFGSGSSESIRYPDLIAALSEDAPAALTRPPPVIASPSASSTALRDFRNKLGGAASSNAALLKYFRMMDVDMNGRLSVAELQAGMEALGIALPDSESAELVQRYSEASEDELGFEGFKRLLGMGGPAVGSMQPVTQAPIAAAIEQEEEEQAEIRSVPSSLSSDQEDDTGDSDDDSSSDDATSEDDGTDEDSEDDSASEEEEEGGDDGGDGPSSALGNHTGDEKKVEEVASRNKRDDKEGPQQVNRGGKYHITVGETKPTGGGASISTPQSPGPAQPKAASSISVDGGSSSEETSSGSKSDSATSGHGPNIRTPKGPAAASPTSANKDAKQQQQSDGHGAATAAVHKPSPSILQKDPSPLPNVAVPSSGLIEEPPKVYSDGKEEEEGEEEPLAEIGSLLSAESADVEDEDENERTELMSDTAHQSAALQQSKSSSSSTSSKGKKGSDSSDSDASLSLSSSSEASGSEESWY